MKTFKTLLKREWMQHQLGWSILMAAPLVIAVLIIVFGHSVVAFNDQTLRLGSDGGPPLPEAPVVAFAAMAAMAMVTLVLTWMSSLLQTPSLARRDQQDRSIEFWLSLPTGHVQSLAATLSAHLVLVPWLALGVGALGGILVSVLVVAKAAGLAAWFSLPWGHLLLALAALVLRTALGLLLATLWLSPLILMVMAASAWLKRWGLAVVIAAVSISGNVMERFYGSRIVWDMLKAVVMPAGNAVSLTINAGGDEGTRGFHINNASDALSLILDLPRWMVSDMATQWQGALSLSFVAALLVAACGFALLVLKRQRGA
jgi:hypothetical protein